MVSQDIETFTYKTTVSVGQTFLNRKKYTSTGALFRYARMQMARNLPYDEADETAELLIEKLAEKYGVVSGVKDDYFYGDDTDFKSLRVNKDLEKYSQLQRDLKSHIATNGFDSPEKMKSFAGTEVIENLRQYITNYLKDENIAHKEYRIECLLASMFKVEIIPEPVFTSPDQVKLEDLARPDLTRN